MTIRQTKELLAQTQGWWCYYCGIPLIATDLLDEIPWELITRPNYPNLDHVVARSQGGGDELDNLVLTCKRCNSRKGTRAQADYQALLAAEAPGPLSPLDEDDDILVSHALFFLMPVMSNEELRVVLVMSQVSSIAHSPLTIPVLMEATGMGRQHVIAGLTIAIERGIVERCLLPETAALRYGYQIAFDRTEEAR